MSYQFNRNGDPIAADIERQRADLAFSSAALRDRILEFFRRWERENGFKRGAGVLLVPAGWRPHK